MQKQKIIVIGDVHGERCWKDIVKKHPGGRFVFLGDYCDPYDKELSDNDVVENLKQIIEFKKEHLDNVTLLLGNHDVQYIYDRVPVCSRFMVYSICEINALFKKNISLFVKIYSFKNLLFTHAGVTEKWYNTAFPCQDSKDVAETINQSHNKKSLFACGIARGGRERYGGIFWADKKEMVEPLKGYVHIVGHSRVFDIESLCTDNGTSVLFCDALWNSKYLIIEIVGNSYVFSSADVNAGEMVKLLNS